MGPPRIVDNPRTLFRGANPRILKGDPRSGSPAPEAPKALKALEMQRGRGKGASSVNVQARQRNEGSAACDHIRFQCTPKALEAPKVPKAPDGTGIRR